ncbi:uncharacterized protein LOC124717040 isoform X2 [Schistocerca piceifrons]|uniref:uncharacterized protein LOC124717040 isoform X2 n=1 Tax=Schistocerca piceifrons TaxID=274613 RepID=UPI001F5E4667|nr:uncharacterized protein LOC124717040 isoform X2 [Schistocerca piceifrons]
MQTKNVNLSQDQLNNSALEKNAQLIQQQQQQPLSPASPGSPPPPLPPRAPAEVEAAGYGQPYKPVPPPKPLPAAASGAASGAASPPPPYRMPPYPLYGDAQTVPIPGSAAAASDLQPGVALHTHSSKFPIEREVILSSADKNSKIPILHEYKKRTKPATIAPEGPNKQIAWTEDKRQHLQQHHTMHGPVNGSDDTLVLTTRTLHSLNLGDKSMALEDMSHQMYKAQPLQVPNEASRGKDYRSQFHNPYLYNGHHANAASTGAVPRAWGSSAQGRPPVPNQGPPGGQHQHQHHQQQLSAAPQQHHQDSGSSGTASAGAVRRDHSGERARQAQQQQQQGSESELVEDQNCGTENNMKDKDGKDCGDKVAGKTFSTRTYHTIKDMISSRFGSGKLPKDVNASGADVEQGKSSQEGLNNNAVVNGDMGSEKSSPRKVRPQPLTSREDAEDEQRQQRLLGGGPSVSVPQGASAQPTPRSYAASGSEPAGAASYQYQQHASENTVPSTSGYYHHQTPAGPRSHQQQQRQKALSPMSQQQANYASQLEQAGVYMVMRQTGASTSVAASSGQYLQAQQQYHMAGQQERADSGNAYATANLSGAPGLLAQKQPALPPPQAREGRRGSQSRLDLPDDEDDDDDEGGFAPPGVSAPPPPPPSTEPPRTASSGQSSDYEKATQRSTGQSSSTAGDSGRGSTVYSSGRQPSVGGSSGGGGSVGGAGLPTQKDRLDTSTESSGSPRVGYGLHHQQAGAGAEPEWVDVVENELRQILDPKLHGLGAGSAVSGGGGANSTLSESISSLTPPLPPLSPGGSPTPVPRSYKHANSLPYGSKLGDYDGSSRKGLAPSHQQSASGKPRGGRLPGGGGGGTGKPGSATLAFDKHHRSVAAGGAGSRSNKDTKSKQLSASVFGLDTTDLTSTTTGGLDSVLDGHTENNSSDDDLSTTIDVTDAQAIRRQLEGLESMYSEVLKLLGVKKGGSRYPPSDPPRLSQRRRVYGSLSSLPSSASSRPPATRPHERRRHDDHRKKVRDLKGINKRFQRLESHVVTLARSVAHLSSEMRTQHLMIQEMENIRGEIAALRTQTALHHHRSQSVPRALNVAGGAGPQGDSAGGLSNPSRVRKLTKFFGDEPPLLRLFLRRLGYEKYANVFENERVGMVELPYLTEERLQRMGVPLGPRIRILQEAQNFPPAPAPTAAQTAATPSSRHDKVYVV